jgi:hypothetical protein
MAIRDLFTKRAARAAKTGAPDVYQYEVLPQPFRVQVVHIFERALGREFPIIRHSLSRLGDNEHAWDLIEKGIAEEHGLFDLSKPKRFEREPFVRVANYFLNADIGQALDVVEVVMATIDEHVRPDLQFAANYCTQHPNDAIRDLNQRLREHAIGYQYVDGQILRVDSQYLHREAVKPALALMQGAGFAGPEDEFMRAHKHYREGNYKEALNDALKAFESTLKSICTARKWHYDKNRDTASKLVEIVLREGLVPAYLDSAMGGLRSLLTSMVPTPRNRESGHGQGPEPVAVPAHVAAYALHATAANIVFLVEAHNAKPQLSVIAGSRARSVKTAAA